MVIKGHIQHLIFCKNNKNGYLRSPYEQFKRPQWGKSTCLQLLFWPWYVWRSMRLRIFLRVVSSPTSLILLNLHLIWYRLLQFLVFSAGATCFHFASLNKLHFCTFYHCLSGGGRCKFCSLCHHNTTALLFCSYYPAPHPVLVKKMVLALVMHL